MRFRRSLSYKTEALEDEMSALMLPPMLDSPNDSINTTIAQSRRPLLVLFRDVDVFVLLSRFCSVFETSNFCYPIQSIAIPYFSKQSETVTQTPLKQRSGSHLKTKLHMA
jgi:hypothetical protein